jgi:hypothetical protein
MRACEVTAQALGAADEANNSAERFLIRPILKAVALRGETRNENMIRKNVKHRE